MHKSLLISDYLLGADSEKCDCWNTCHFDGFYLSLLHPCSYPNGKRQPPTEGCIWKPGRVLSDQPCAGEPQCPRDNLGSKQGYLFVTFLWLFLSRGEQPTSQRTNRVTRRCPKNWGRGSCPTPKRLFLAVGLSCPTPKSIITEHHWIF